MATQQWGGQQGLPGTLHGKLGAELAAAMLDMEAQGTLAGSLYSIMDTLDRTPLECALECSAKQPGLAAQAVRLFVAAGADPVRQGGLWREFPEGDEDGPTTLGYAVRWGPDDPALAGLLMGAGCDPGHRSVLSFAGTGPGT